LNVYSYLNTYYYLVLFAQQMSANEELQSLIKENEYLKKQLRYYNQTHEMSFHKNEDDQLFYKDKPISAIYTFIDRFFHRLQQFIQLLYKACGIYLLWICLHYASSHIYVELCVPKTVNGFILSPFMINAPHCQGLRWIIYNAASVVNQMWKLIGDWLYSLLWVKTIVPVSPL